MTTNVRMFSSNPPYLNISDLAVGDKLAHVTIVSQYSGPGYSSIETVEVVKILKTRLVVKNATGHEYRVIVAFSKNWPSQNGIVTTTLEGDSGSYRRDLFRLYTLDDAELPAMAVRSKLSAVRRNTRNVVSDLAKSLQYTPEVADLDAAITAITELRALLAANPTNES